MIAIHVYFVLSVFFLRDLLGWFPEGTEAEEEEVGMATAWPDVSMCRNSLFLYERKREVVVGSV